MLFASNAHAHSSSVSQFTLLASTKKGSKPDFHGALGGERAKELYDVFFLKVQEGYKPERVKDGVFQAMMVSFRCQGF
jgi:D-aminoacyl-tRNA deacylase